MWSMWAWVMTAASIVDGSTGNGSQLRSRSSFNPWYSPQSTRTRVSGVSTRKRLPVTVPVPPRTVSTVGRLGGRRIPPSHVATLSEGSRRVGSTSA